MLGPVPFFSLKVRLACFCLALSLLPYASFSQSLPTPPKSEKSKWEQLCEINLRKAGRTLRIMTVLGATLLAGPRIVNESVGLVADTSHIGGAIYLDASRVEALLSPDEQRLLDNVPKDQKAIIEMFADKISGDYDTEYLQANTRMPSVRFVSSYFKGQCKKRGICRDKSLALQAVLNHYGIKAEIRTASGGHPDANGTILQPYGHQWVYLPELDAVSDPTEAAFKFKIVDRKKFESEMESLGYRIDSPSTFSESLQFIREGLQR